LYPRTQVIELRSRVLPYNIAGVTSLLDRIGEILEETKLNPSQLAAKAELKERTHVHTLMRRLRAKPDASLDMPTLVAIARAGNVTLDWLITGQEPKRPPIADADPKYPSRASALAAARLLGWPEAAIAQVAAVDNLASDPGAEHWMQRLMVATRELAAGAHKNAVRESKP
jgi:hypothetical protein